MGCVYCGCVTIPDEAICPECLVDVPLNRGANFDPYTDEEMNKINDDLLLAVVLDDPEVELKPEFIEEILSNESDKERSDSNDSRGSSTGNDI